MKHKKQFWLFLTALVIVFCGLFNTQSIKAAYSNKQLRSYAQKTMKKNHLRGSIVIVKNGHRQTVNMGYGYYKRHLKMAAASWFIQLAHYKKWLQRP